MSEGPRGGEAAAAPHLEAPELLAAALLRLVYTLHAAKRNDRRRFD